MTWLTPIIVIPVLLFLGGMGYLLMRNAMRVWLDHRVKQGILEKFEQHPDLLDSFDELNVYLDGWEEQTRTPPLVDPLHMGLLLTGVGLLTSLFTWAFGHGQIATSSYVGGVLTVVLGFILTMVGLAIRYLLRPPSEEMLRKRLKEFLKKATQDEHP